MAGTGGGGTAVFASGVAACAGCAGGADGTGRAGVCDAVGAGGAGWADGAGAAGGVGVDSAERFCARVGAGSADGAGGAVLASIIVHLDEVGGVRRLYIRGMEVAIPESASSRRIEDPADGATRPSSTLRWRTGGIQ